MLGSNPRGIGVPRLNSAHGLVTTDKLQSAHMLNVGAFFCLHENIVFAFLKNEMYLCGNKASESHEKSTQKKIKSLFHTSPLDVSILT